MREKSFLALCTSQELAPLFAFLGSLCFPLTRPKRYTFLPGSYFQPSLKGGCQVGRPRESRLSWGRFLRTQPGGGFFVSHGAARRFGILRLPFEAIKQGFPPFGGPPPCPETGDRCRSGAGEFWMPGSLLRRREGNCWKAPETQPEEGSPGLVASPKAHKGHSALRYAPSQPQASKHRHAWALDSDASLNEPVTCIGMSVRFPAIASEALRLYHPLHAAHGPAAQSRGVCDLDP